MRLCSDIDPDGKNALNYYLLSTGKLSEELKSEDSFSHDLRLNDFMIDLVIENDSIIRIVQEYNSIHAAASYADHIMCNDIKTRIMREN
jgi:hypothetical protein